MDHLILRLKVARAIFCLFHIINAGYPSIESLKGQDPEEIYFKDCKYQNAQVDRCALYVYRLAVAYANGTITDSEKLKWWNWKD
jgi:hypothetical protein